MKNYLIVFFIVLLSQSVNAQFTKGTISLGLSGGYSNKFVAFSERPSSTNRISKGYSVYISPEINYFLKPKLSLGTSIGISESIGFSYLRSPEINATEEVELKSSSKGMNVQFLLKYFIPINEKFYLLCNIRQRVGFESLREGLFRNTYLFFEDENTKRANYPYGKYTSTTQSFQTGISFVPSVLFLPHNNWGLEFSFGNLLGVLYSKNKMNPNISYGYEVNENNFELKTFNLASANLSLSLYYYFRKKSI